MNIAQCILYILAGLGAGVVTGLAGLSAAVVITPVLVSLCGWASYGAVTVALASDVLASLLSAYTYYKNKNIDLKRGSLVTVTAFLGTIIGSYCGYLFSQQSPDALATSPCSRRSFSASSFCSSRSPVDTTLLPRPAHPPARPSSPWCLAAASAGSAALPAAAAAS